MLTRIDVRRNTARFYKLDIQPTLFDEWSLVREWGRISRPGTVRAETLRTAEQPTWHLLPRVREASKRSSLITRQST
ncbi:WGR domain-containing protein [Bradyrhizobium barranii]|uniref:WGR domain-containing protein n=1 Tax=Bradyrhizobium barranii TaxID=2992140 RepID=UPI001AA16505|nr:WGR domain-containing protein [Bradyrhizobium barranii]